MTITDFFKDEKNITWCRMADGTLTSSRWDSGVEIIDTVRPEDEKYQKLTEGISLKRFAVKGYEYVHSEGNEVGQILKIYPTLAEAQKAIEPGAKDTGGVFHKWENLFIVGPKLWIEEIY